MAKTKKNRRNMADKVRTAKSTKEKKLNPFELRINKQKHTVLGRNQNIRGQVGNPGQSRAKAYKQRCKTLLVELKHSKKTNVFKDQRLGEKISGLSQDEKAMQRFALERKIQHQKNKLAEEGEEEQLTHYGQSLAEIEKFDDIEPDSDSDEDGRLGGQVAEEHFGGFLTRKPESEKGNWKERMAELISQTRKQKYERQSEKDSVLKKTEEVDAEFKALNHLLVTPRIEDKGKPKADDYDIKVRSLQFEAKGTPSDRLKTEDELAKEEAERLKTLEADRKRRMKGELAEQEPPTHISADSLDDGFSYTAPQRNSVSFLQDTHANDEGNKEETDDEDDGKDGGKEEERADVEDSDSDDDDDDDEDLESDEEEDEEEAEKLVQKLLQKKMEEKKGAPKSILKKKTVAAVIDSKEKLLIAEKAKKEIPYTFEAPEDVEGMTSLLGKYSVEDQVTVVERLVACHHPSLTEGNKQKLQTMFSLLLQYLLDSLVQDDPPVQLFDRLTPVLYQLLRHNPEASTTALTQLLLDRHDEFEQICQRRGGRGRYMGLDTMLLLKLISVLYPTSDFKHPVVTPAFHFMAAMLGQTPVTNERDIAAGLYLCALCSEYVSLSKRYIPEVINFLHGILFLASTKDPKKVGKVFPPFKPVGNFIDLLKVKSRVTDVPMMSVVKTLANDVEKQQLDNDEFRVSSISTCVRLIQEFSHLYSSLPSVAEIFTPVRDMLNKLPTSQYPQGLQDCIEHLKAILSKDASKPLEALTMEKKKPQPLKMFEPRIEEVFDGRKKRKGTREQLERQRMQHKVKKEFKGAMREIRKDSQFLARQQLKATMEKDADRQKKLKRLYADLSNQEGEVRALKRMKDRASK